MIYKFPKEIRVNGTVFKISYDYKDFTGGASFSYPANGDKAWIRFSMGNHENNKLMFLELIIHELKEIIQHEQGTRLYNVANDSYSFHYDHKEHQYLCGQIADVLTKFIK